MRPQFEDGDETLYRVVGYRVDDGSAVFLSNTYNTLGKAKAKRTGVLNEEKRRVNDWNLDPRYRRVVIEAAEIRWTVVDIEGRK